MDEILDLDLAELGDVDVVVPAFDVEVTSVTRQESTVGKSAAAIFVITPEMIRRSGANSIPELMRMVPGLHVGRITSSQFAITSRGFNDQFAGKLLVLLDGRSVYTPVFAGVYWDTLDVVLADIERIEIIRGPGATVWGANAVNGVINIITRKAGKTQGTLASAGGGEQDRAIGVFRHGGQVGDDLDYRIFSKYTDRAHAYRSGGGNDDWRVARTGFRMDWTPANAPADRWMFQGDVYDGSVGESGFLATPDAPFSRLQVADTVVQGGYGLGRWTHTYDDQSSTSLQFYYDHTHRNSPEFNQKVAVFDVDLQHDHTLWDRHRVTWGLGFRHVRDAFSGDDSFVISFSPRRRQVDRVGTFVQDQISFFDDSVLLTVGTKLSNNEFTGFEIQPSARLLWSIDTQHAVWTAVSRAVRTPARAFDDIRLTQWEPPTLVTLVGSRDTESENLIAYEIGYREQTNERFSWDVAAFFNDYTDLTATSVIGFQPTIPPNVLLTINNSNAAQTYGVEYSANFAVTKDWQLRGWYSFLKLDVNGPDAPSLENDTPHNQAYLMSTWNLPADFEFDLMGRYVDSVSTYDVANYISLDARLGWQINHEWELSVVGQNLLENHHLEYGPRFNGTGATEVTRGVYAQLTLRR